MTCVIVELLPINTGQHILELGLCVMELISVCGLGIMFLVGSFFTAKSPERHRIRQDDSVRKTTLDRVAF